MKGAACLSLHILLLAPTAATAAEVKTGEAEDASLAMVLVRKLDAVRLPATSFVVDVEATERRSDEPPREMSFRLYGKPGSGASSRTIASLVVMQKPAGDQNKLILMKEARVWFYDPRSRNATALSARQLWQHSFAAESMTVRIEDQYVAKVAGRETIETLDDGKKSCVVIDLQARGKAVTAAETVRYWLSTQGRPYQSVYYSASGKAIRTCRFGGYAEVLGQMRPTRLVVDDIRGSSTFKFSTFQAAELPDSIFEPENLPRLRLRAGSER